MTLPEITHAIAKTVRAHSSHARFSGVVRVELGERVLFEEARGLANRSDSLLNEVHTRFQMASGCKLFTAVAICQLVEEGRLSLDTRLGECLSEDFPRFDPAVTIRHLLTHTSGVPDYFDEAGGADYEALWRKPE